MSPWVKISDDPPDAADWLHCSNCGHLALLTRENVVYGAEVGDPCKYCNTPYKPATEENMRAAYPQGQWWWNAEDVGDVEHTAE